MQFLHCIVFNHSNYYIFSLIKQEPTAIHIIEAGWPSIHLSCAIVKCYNITQQRPFKWQLSQFLHFLIVFSYIRSV